MLRTLAAAGALAAFLVGPLAAQTPSAAVPDSTVAALAFLEGHWRIPAGDPAIEQYPELAEVDIVEATWVVGGKAMRWLDHVARDGTAEAEGLIFWDPAVEKIRFVGVGGPGEGQGRLFVGTWTPLADGRVERLYDVYYRTLADMPGEELGGSRRATETFGPPTVPTRSHTRWSGGTRGGGNHTRVGAIGWCGRVEGAEISARLDEAPA